MAENPFLDQGFTTELITDLEAFFAGNLVECYECEHFVLVERCNQHLVKLPGDPHPLLRYMCNECRTEQQICDQCESEGEDGEVFQTKRLNEPGNFYDVWICDACLES